MTDSLKERVIDYHVVTSATLRNVTRTVKEYIKAGWEPHGSLQIHLEFDPTASKNVQSFFQPMVRRSHRIANVYDY